MEIRKPNRIWMPYLLIFTLTPIHTSSPLLSPSFWKQMPAHVGTMTANIIQLLLSVISYSSLTGLGTKWVLL